MTRLTFTEGNHQYRLRDEHGKSGFAWEDEQPVTGFVGEVHPLADVWPLLEGDDLAALAESIAEHGLRDPIVIDGQGRVLDGRNRLAACRAAGVPPTYVTLPDLDTEERIAAFIQVRNAERRHLTPGQQAMGRALMLQAQGKRADGRWARGTVDIHGSVNISGTDRNNLAKAGLVLDTAARAAVLGPDFAEYTLLPAQVMGRTYTLEFAYRMGQAFEGKAALAEAMKTQPLTEALTRAEVILDDLEELFPLPQLPVALTKQHRAQLESITRRARQIAARYADHLKENK